MKILLLAALLVVASARPQKILGKSVRLCFCNGDCTAVFVKSCNANNFYSSGQEYENSWQVNVMSFVCIIVAASIASNFAHKNG